MDKLIDFLQKIKNPEIDPDREELIEEIVGDSVVEAYGCGFRDGCKVGRYNLAQEIMKLLKDYGYRQEFKLVSNETQEMPLGQKNCQMRQASEKQCQSV